MVKSSESSLLLVIYHNIDTLSNIFCHPTIYQSMSPKFKNYDKIIHFTIFLLLRSMFKTKTICYNIKAKINYKDFMIEKNKIKKIVGFSFAILGLLLFLSHSARAQEFISAPPSYDPNFNPNFLISDEDLTNYNSMDIGEIYDFLKRQPGKLGSLVPDQEQRKTAAQIIWEAAQTYFINPQYIITLLQKEQGLVEDPDPSDYQLNWATGYKICDHCNPLEDPETLLVKGFAKQVDRAANRHKMYMQDLSMDGQTVSGWAVGKTKRSGAPYNRNDSGDSGWEKINGQPSYVTPINKATAALYTYTPWVGGPSGVGGNYLFWTLWNKYWGKPLYPDGTLLQASEAMGKYWLLQNGTRRPFTSKSAFLSNYSEDQVLTISTNDLNKYPIGTPIKYPNYSLLESDDKAKTIFLLVDETKRKFESRKTFAKFGYNPEELIKVKADELKQYPDGPMITSNDLYPNGGLVQDKKTGGVYFAQANVKRAIISKELLKLYYAGRKIRPLTTKELDKFQTGDPIKIKDGTLVKLESSEDVYVISNGNRLLIPSQEMFKQLGYQTKNIITVSEKLLNLHPLTGNVGGQTAASTITNADTPVSTTGNATQNVESTITAPVNYIH